MTSNIVSLFFVLYLDTYSLLVFYLQPFFSTPFLPRASNVVKIANANVGIKDGKPSDLGSGLGHVQRTFRHSCLDYSQRRWLRSEPLRSREVIWCGLCIYLSYVYRFSAARYWFWNWAEPSCDSRLSSWGCVLVSHREYNSDSSQCKANTQMVCCSLEAQIVLHRLAMILSYRLFGSILCKAEMNSWADKLHDCDPIPAQPTYSCTCPAN